MQMALKEANKSYYNDREQQYNQYANELRQQENIWLKDIVQVRSIYTYCDMFRYRYICN